MESSQGVLTSLDDAPLKRVHWEWTFLAAMGDYLDAGSIVAGGSSLAVWASFYHLNLGLIGLIGAFSSNGISTAVGALVGGRLGDIYGRKFIYGLDLLLYAIGTLPIIFAFNAPMVIIGTYMFHRSLTVKALELSMKRQRKDAAHGIITRRTHFSR